MTADEIRKAIVENVRELRRLQMAQADALVDMPQVAEHKPITRQGAKVMQAETKRRLNQILALEDRIDEYLKQLSEAEA